jgi:DnaJ family protein C protein 2
MTFRREERKWIEKQNKAARAKRKKEEMTRIRSLVDTAYSLDPRILKFKQEDKDRKLAVKQAKKDAARARQEEEDRVRKLVGCTVPTSPFCHNSANTNS